MSKARASLPKEELKMLQVLAALGEEAGMSMSLPQRCMAVNLTDTEQQVLEYAANKDVCCFCFMCV